MTKQKNLKVVLDLEADGLLHEATRIHCAVGKCIDTGKLWHFTPDNIDKLPEFLDTVSVLIMHKGIDYDKPLMEKVLGYEYKGKLIDTLIMSQTMRLGLTKPAGCGNIGPHSVEAYGIRYGRSKPENEDWSKYTDHILHRCEEDVHITHMIYNDLMENEYTKDWAVPLRITHKFFELTSKMERFGWLFDDVKARRLVRILEYLIHRIDRAVHKEFPLRLIRRYQQPLKKPFKKNGELSAAALGWLERHGEAYTEDSICGPFSRISWEQMNLGSTQQVTAYLLADGWIPKEWNHKKDPKTKRPMYDENGELILTSPKLSQKDDFEGVSSDSGKKLAKRIQLAHRKSYLEGLLKSQRPDGRIGCGVAGLAKTYRVRHRGIVNTPNASAFLGGHIRSLFICPEGYKLASVDASNCQVRAEAARANNPEYTKMLLEGKKEDGTDNHSVVTKAVNRVLERYKAPEINRDKGKGFNFALKFGCGDAKLANMAGLPEKCGAEIRASIASEFAAQDKLIKKMTNEWRRNAKAKRNRWGGVRYTDGYIRGLDGRPVYIDSEHKVLVYGLQSDETVTMMVAFCMWHKYITDAGLKEGDDFKIICSYHDEMTAEVKEEYAEMVKTLGEKAIVDASKWLKMSVPQLGEGEVGDNWRDVH